MARLSSPIEELKTHYGVVVVGSGYGGGISASRLARAGQEVCVLERGKEFQPGEYPNTRDAAFDEVQMDLWFDSCVRGSRKGLFDLRFNPEMNVFVGCGLGGTSLVNANVCMEAENRVFEQPEWPIEIRKPEGLAEMAEGYRLAKEMLKPVAYNFSNEPKKFPPLSKLSALEQSAAHLQEPFSPTPINVTFEELPNNTNHVGVEQHRCVGCGDCMSGCNYGAKNTVLMNYLPDAKNHGAEIFTEISVRRIEKHETRWLIHYQILQTGEEAVDSPTRAISADVVVLAAGTLGSTEILLRSKEHLALSQRVGQNFTGNGDVLAFGYNCDKKINGVGFGAFSPTGREPVGPCITGIIDARRKPNLQDCLVIEEGSMAGAFAPLLPQLFALAGTLSSRDTDRGFLDKIREQWRKWVSLRRGAYHGAVKNTQTFLVMGHDDGQGQMSLKEDRLRIDWEGVGDQPAFTLANQKVKEATLALGGSYLKNPVTNTITGNDLITVHPLGGCVMADKAENGVVNHKGQVFSGPMGSDVYSSLYVSDGSIIPRALGINPLLTISALAERCVALMANDRGWTIDYSPSLPFWAS